MSAEISVYWYGLSWGKLTEEEERRLAQVFLGYSLEHHCLRGFPLGLPKGTLGRKLFLFLLVASPEVLGGHDFTPVSHSQAHRLGDSDLTPQEGTISLYLSQAVAKAGTPETAKKRLAAINQAAGWLERLKRGLVKGHNRAWGYQSPNGGVTKWPWG